MCVQRELAQGQTPSLLMVLHTLIVIKGPADPTQLLPT